MFYSQFILAKKGPLGTIWIAAHLERKLRKNQVADTDIGFSVDSILFPEMPIALRLSSHLLLGVVRIYSRKVNYLFDDCSEALLKVKQAFRSTAVDLPPEESTAPYHSITLPETFDLDDFELPGTDIYQGNYVDHHISSKEQITLQDTMDGVVYSTSNFGLDERFGDGDACGLDLDEELMVEKAETAEHAIGTSNSEEMAAVTIVNQQMEEYDGGDEPIEYAHAPCTPGLWEEPNLSNIQETSAYDDHQEHENHTITEFAVKENFQNDSSQQQHDNQFEPLEKSPPHIIVSTEQMMMNDVGSSSTTFTESNTVDQVRSMSPIAEVSETVVSMVDDPVKMVDLLYKNAMDQVPEVQTIDDNRENYVENQSISNNVSHVVNKELELNTEPLSPQDSAFMQPQDSTIPVESTHDLMGLRPCVTFPNHDASCLPPSEFTSLPSVETSRNDYFPEEVSHTTEPLERNLQENYGPSNEVQVASNIQVENVIETNTSNFPASEKVVSFSEHLDVVQSTPLHESAYISNRQVDNVNQTEEFQVNNSNSYTSNFSAPEKLLSFSQHVVPESTPIIAPGFEGNAGNNSMYSGITLTESLMTTQSITESEYNTNRYSGRKRSITESSMSLNFNLNESSSFFTTNTTKEPFRDDDLLSSILVGRNSSILKMKPTPSSTEAPPTKRRRRQSAASKTTVIASAPRTGVSKRKVVWDDNMVLHGDTIRQQLTNTEDIRRLRKKAPCTHSEVSLIQKQFWQDELFGQPILTGMSNKLTGLQRELYDISKIVVPEHDSAASLEAEMLTHQKSMSHNDEKEIEIQPEMGAEKTSVSIQPDVVEENKEEDNLDPVVVVGKDVSEVEPVDVPKENKDEDDFDPVVIKDVSESQPVDNHTHDFDTNNTTNLDYYENQQQMVHTINDFTELFGPEHDILDQATAMEIDDNNTFQDPASDVGVGVEVSVMHPVEVVEVELQTHADVVQSDTNDTSAAAPLPVEVEKTSHNKVVSLLTGPPPGFGFDTYKKVNVESVIENDPIPSIDININKESIESNVDSEIKLHGDGEIPEERQEFVADASIDDGFKSDGFTLNQDTEIRNDVEEEIANKDLVPNGKEFVAVEAYDGEGYPVLEDVLLDAREKPTLNLEDIPTVNVDDNDYMYSGVANDTDFLNLDDVDDNDEAADDYDGDAETTKILDNSGWSSRTKAVAKYLQIMFDKEGERGRNMLGVNNLLAGKTRREASRMFFETLVLKTKDYIHVEQADPYENINVFPRAKLLKSEFYKD